MKLSVTAPPITDPVFLTLSRIVLPIVTVSKDGTASAIGSCFIVHADGKKAIALSAAHNLIEIGRKDRPYDTWHPTTLPEFRPTRSEIDLSYTLPHVLYPDERGNFIVAELSPVYVLRDFDIAVCVLKITDESSDVSFNEWIAIDSSVPTTDTAILAVGYCNMSVRCFEVGNDVATGKYDHTLTRRKGKISSVFSSKGPRNQPYPCFQCTVRFDHGMSGGPIIDISREEPVAVGIISSDWSFDMNSAFPESEDTGLASILWPAMGISLSREVVDGIYAPPLLKFEELGLIKDRGQAHQHVMCTTGKDGDSSMMWT